LDRSRAYLAEKNRLLTERVEKLERLFEWKNERIDELEADVERLTAELIERAQATSRTHEEQAIDVNPDEGNHSWSLSGIGRSGCSETASSDSFCAPEG